jgi:biopolymer transport protein TolQ
MRPGLIVQLVTCQTGRHVWDSFREAGLFGQMICIGLGIVSMICWAIILKKAYEFFLLRQDEEKFSDIFRQLGGDFGTIQDRSERCPDSCQARIFREVYQELSLVARMSGQELVMTKEVLRLAEQRAERALTESLERLDRHLSFLATATNVCPIVGLLGTIWGLLGAFRSMGMAGNANVTTVGTGVSEALITTLVGLAAAIPAAFFYTYYRSLVNRTGSHLEVFVSDLLSRLSRNALYHSHSEPKTTVRPRRRREEQQLAGITEG